MTTATVPTKKQAPVIHAKAHNPTPRERIGVFDKPMKFRVNIGHYGVPPEIEGDEPIIYGRTVQGCTCGGKIVRESSGKPPCESCVRFPHGDIVETIQDLRRFNTNGCEKFTLIDEAEPMVAPSLPDTAHVWDSAIESFEEFMARVHSPEQTSEQKAASEKAKVEAEQAKLKSKYDRGQGNK